MGTIQQRYRPRNGSPTRAFAEWISDINNLVFDKLIPVLIANDVKELNMILNTGVVGWGFVKWSIWEKQDYSHDDLIDFLALKREVYIAYEYFNGKIW